MKRALALLILVTGPATAQIPRAEAVDPALNQDAATDYFLRGRKTSMTRRRQPSFRKTGSITIRRAAQIFNGLPEFLPRTIRTPRWRGGISGNSYYQSGQMEEGKRCFSTLLNRYGQGKWAAAAAYTLAADIITRPTMPLPRRCLNDMRPTRRNPRTAHVEIISQETAIACWAADREAISAFKKVVEDPAGGTFRRTIERSRSAISRSRRASCRKRSPHSRKS